MPRKIMIIAGSPRVDGNTATLVQWLATAARGKGAEVEIVDASRLRYAANGCTACMGCQKRPEYECVLKDEASPVLARMPAADVLVFATPVYFFGPSAQLKLLLDRMFCLVKFKPEENKLEHALAGKTMALVASGGGDTGSGLALVEQTFRSVTGFLGLGLESLLVPFAPQRSGEMTAKDDMRRQAEALGRKLAGDGDQA